MRWFLIGLSLTLSASAAAAFATASRPVAAPESWSEFLFPLRSTAMKPAAGVERRWRGLPRAIFVIGDDAASRAWLSRQRHRLRSLDAVGMVVEATSARRFEALRALAPELPMAPVGDDQLASQLGLRSYPALLIGE